MNLIYCLTPRCGSTSLAQAIEWSTGNRVCAEPFNPDCHEGRFAMNYRVHKHNLGDVSGLQKDFEMAYADILRDRQLWSVLKHLREHLNEEDNKNLINKSDSILYLYRNNLFDYIVSMHLSRSISEDPDNIMFWNFSGRAKVFGHSEMSKYAKRAREIYNTRPRSSINTSLFKNWCQDIKNQHIKTKGYLKNKNAMILSYESLYSHSNTKYMEIIDFFGYKIKNDLWKKMFEPINKVASEQAKSLIENYEDVIKYREELILDD